MSLDRYSRQILFTPIGKQGQEKLLASRVTMIGCGALGTGLANNLARAGVGFMRIVDRDFIEMNNLQRQLLFDETDVQENLPKAVAGANRITKINSDIKTEPIVADVNYTNVEEFIKDVDIVLDGTDNFETRFLLNDACVKHGKTWIYGGCVGSYGLVMVVIPGQTACVRCVFENAPPPGVAPTCDTAGVLNTIASIISSYQSTEAIKILTGNMAAVNKNLLSIDIWSNQFMQLKTAKNADCPVCGQKKFEFLEAKEGTHITSLCGRNAVQITQKIPAKMDFADVSKRLSQLGKVTYNKFLLKFEQNDCEITLFTDGRAIVKGTNDTAKARTLYAKYVGS